jgi:hypothetical protein
VEERAADADRFDGAGVARLRAVDFAGLAGARVGFFAGLLALLVLTADLLATTDLKSKSWCRNHRMKSRWDYESERIAQSDPRRSRSPSR